MKYFTNKQMAKIEKELQAMLKRKIGPMEEKNNALLGLVVRAAYRTTEWETLEDDILGDLIQYWTTK